MGAKRGNNEGSIRKRAEGVWEARITLESGKRKSLYGKTRAEVARKLTEALRDFEQGLPVALERQTVGAYLASWLTLNRPPALKPKTYRAYEQMTRLHLVPELGTIQLAKLTPEHVKQMYARKLDSGLSSTTVHHVHAVLHVALEQALQHGFVHRNVCDMVKAPPMRRTAMAVLTPYQARTLLDAAAGDRLEALYVLAITTGLREGELLALKWRDVDFDAHALQIRGTLVYIPGQGVSIDEPKTTTSRRRIALPSIGIEALRTHQARQAEERCQIGPAWQDHDLIFCTPLGTPLDGAHVLRRHLHPLLARAGLPRIRFHDLRHTAATLLLLQGVHPKVVSELLGHASVQITLQLYSHVLPDMQKEATAAMERVFAR